MSNEFTSIKGQQKPFDSHSIQSHAVRIMANSTELSEIFTATTGLQVFPSRSGRKYTVAFQGYFYIHHRTNTNTQVSHFKGTSSILLSK